VEDKPKGNELLAEELPRKIRLMVQTRRKGRGQHYTFVAGYSTTVEIRSVEEAERLWQGVRKLIDSGVWHERGRRVARGGHAAAPADHPQPPAPVGSTAE
jgi:hypothetical protein